MKDAIKMMESKMSPEAVQRARIKAEQEILTIRLSKLREKTGKKQTDFTMFSQTSISCLEKRKDIKISTLLEYLDELDMGVEVRVYPKDKRKKQQEEILLKV